MYWIAIRKYACSVICMVEEFAARPGMRRRPNMTYITSKSWLHIWMGRYRGDLDSVLATGRGAFVIISADPAHCQLNRHVVAEDSGYGSIWQKTAVRHALIPTGGQIASVVVTDGSAAGPPGVAGLRLNAIYGMGLFLGDSACRSGDNCRMTMHMPGDLRVWGTLMRGGPHIGRLRLAGAQTGINRQSSPCHPWPCAGTNCHDRAPTGQSCWPRQSSRVPAGSAAVWNWRGLTCGG